jgi:hypothetical protein
VGGRVNGTSSPGRRSAEEIQEIVGYGFSR